LTDITIFREMDSVYAEFFPEPYFAKATFEGKGILGGLGVKINLVAVKKP